MVVSRFVAVPRPMLMTVVSELPGFRALGERMKAKAVALCPVSEEGEDYQGPHLKDTIELRVITGPDPRIMIGSTRKGQVLAYITNGTSDHRVAPVNAKALRWTSGGTTFFSAGHEVKGVTPNPFIMQAIREVLQEP